MLILLDPEYKIHTTNGRSMKVKVIFYPNPIKYSKIDLSPNKLLMICLLLKNQ